MLTQGFNKSGPATDGPFPRMTRSATRISVIQRRAGYLVQIDGEQPALVSDQGGTPICDCRQGGYCPHVAALYVCGFLDSAAAGTGAAARQLEAA